MPRLIWSQPALFDIQRLYRFLLEQDTESASRAVRVIRKGVKILAQQPHAGRPIDNMEPEYREWPIEFGGSGYIVMYHFDGQTAVIVAVRHQKEVGY